MTAWCSLGEQLIKQVLFGTEDVKRTIYLYMRFSARNLSSGNLSHVSPIACTRTKLLSPQNLLVLSFPALSPLLQGGWTRRVHALGCGLLVLMFIS